MSKSQKNQGFTLVELSVVIVIIGILLAAGLKLFTAQAESAAYSATQKKIDTIRLALSNHLRANRQLPCPDVGTGGIIAPFDGIEDRKDIGDLTKQCLANIGIVPYVSIGLPQSTALDGWDNFITYRIFYVDGVDLDDSTRVATFRSGNLGGLRVVNRFPANNAATTLIVNSAVVVLISHGKNGLGAWTSKSTLNSPPENNAFDEFANNQPGGPYYQRAYSDDINSPFGEFDDIVDFMTANDLLSPIIKDGSMKSAEGTVAEDMQDFRSKLLGYVAANNRNAVFVGSTKNCGPPLTLAAANVIRGIDPWGTAYRYGPLPDGPFNTITSADLTVRRLGVAIAPNQLALTVESAGPDRLFATFDDPTPLMLTATDILSFLTPAWVVNQCL